MLTRSIRIWTIVFTVLIILTGQNLFSQPEVPALSSPAEESVLSSIRPDLSWNSSAGTDNYILQVAIDSLFSNLVYNNTTVIDTVQQVGPLAGNRRYYWRVSAENGTGTSDWSDFWSFVTIPPPQVQTTSVIGSITSAPGSRPFGLTWDGDSLWKIDDIGNLYQFDTLGNGSITPIPVGTFDSDLAWDGSGLWIGGASAAGGAVKISTDGTRIDTLPEHYSASSGIEWDGQYFWLGDNDLKAIHKFRTDSTEYLNWATSGIFGHPTGICYDGIHLWIGGSAEGSANTIYKYTILGELVYSVDLVGLGITAAPGAFTSLAWDGQSLWYGNDQGFTIYKLSVPYYHEAPPAPALYSPLNGATEITVTPTLSWHPSMDAVSYRIQVSKDPAFTTTIFDDSTITETSVSPGTLDYYTTLYWRVSAKNSGGTSSYSGIFSFTTFNNPPSVPSGLKALPGDQQVTLIWDPNPEPDMFKFRIYRDAVSPAAVLFDSVSGSPPDTFYVDTDVTNGSIYFYRIAAVDDAGNESGISGETVAVPVIEQGNAVLLDGQDDYIDLGTGNALDDLGSDFTVAGWMYHSSKSSDHSIFGSVSDGEDRRISLRSNGFTVQPDGQGFTEALSEPVDTGWHHLAGTYDGSNMRFYIDGILMDEQSVDGLLDPVSTSNFIGAHPAHGWHMNGQVDEVSIWNIPLTAEEVMSIKDRPVQGNVPGLLALWHMDEPDTSQTVYDASGNMIHATLMNGAAITGSNAMTPLAPAGLRIFEFSGEDVTLNWTPNTESDLHKYYIYRDTSFTVSVLYDSINGNPPDTSYTDTDADFSRTYYYRITAMDSAGNESNLSEYLVLGDIIVDGLKDPFWETATGVIQLGQDELAWGTVADGDDFSATLYLAYDSAFLYGFVEVNDDSLSSKANWNWWENDAFSLKLDPDPATTIPVPRQSGQDPNWWDIINIEFTAETDFGDERNGTGNTQISRVKTAMGYIVEFAIPASELENHNTDPAETVSLQEGAELGFYFEMSDQDIESYQDAIMAWGHSSANANSGGNVTQYGSMTFLADNQIQLSHDNLVMTVNQPFIQVPNVQLSHTLYEDMNEDWHNSLRVYVNHPLGLDEIDSVWVVGPDAGHYLLNDANESCDNWASDGRYRYCGSNNSPPPEGVYQFYAADKSGNTVSVTDTLTGILDVTVIVSPENYSFISQPDFLIEWEAVPGATNCWIDILRAYDWDNYWQFNPEPDQTSVTYNENSEGIDLVPGEIYILQVSVDNERRNTSHTRVKIVYTTEGIIVIDGSRDLFWESATGQIHLDQDELVWGETDGEDDCSANLYLAWDSLFLYAFLEVKDDSVSSRSWDNWWENDAISLKLDADPTTIVAMPYYEGNHPNWWDIINIEITAQSSSGEVRHGLGNTLMSRVLTDTGYVVELAIPASDLVNYNTDPAETVSLQQGTQLGLYFEMADQDTQTEKEAVLAWGHASANLYSGRNVTHYGSLTFQSGNQIQLSHDNLVMSADEPFIQAPSLSMQHNFSHPSSEWWELSMLVYLNDPQGLSDIDSVWAEGPDGSHYRLLDNGQDCDEYDGDGQYYLCDSYDPPPQAGVYDFYARDHSGNIVSLTDSLGESLDYPEVIAPENNTLISEPDFLIDWDEVAGATGYSLNVNLSSNWEHFWDQSFDTTQTSTTYNADGNGRDLVSGEVYYISIYANDGRRSSRTTMNFAYNTQDFIIIDGIKDAAWDTVTALIQLDPDDLVWGEVSDEDDLSANLYLAYDASYLYGFIEVKDDSLSSKADWSWWDNDALMLKFDIDPLSVIPIEFNSGDVPNGQDIVSIEITAETGFGDERNGNDKTILSRAVTDTGYVIEFAISASGLTNHNTDPVETVVLEAGTQLGFYFELGDQDEGSEREGTLAWGHSSVNQNSSRNVTQFGSISMQSGNRIQLSNDNLVMDAVQPYIQVPFIESEHNMEDTISEWWNYNFYVYANDPQGLDDIDSVWAEAPDGSHYLLYDDATHGDDGPPGDGLYRFNYGPDSPLSNALYTFHVVDKSGNISNISDSLTATLDCPQNLIPRQNTIVSEPDFLIQWDKVPGMNGYWINVNLTSNWEHVWNIWVDSSRNSVTYNENGSGQDLVEGENYYIQVNCSDGRNYAQTRTRISYATQHLIIIDGVKDPFWNTATGHIHIGQDEIVDGMADGADDCSADLYLAYDSVFLYGYIEVKDNVIGSAVSWNWWDNDALSLKFDTDPFTLIPIPVNQGSEPNGWDVSELQFTAEAGYDDERNGNDNTSFSRLVSDTGYVIEFAVTTAGLINNNTEPPETLIYNEGSQAGLYFAVADQDSEPYREAELAWGHASANLNSPRNVTQYGSMTFLADNQVQLSRYNLVMSGEGPYIQRPFIQSSHSMDQHMNESWGISFEVYLNDPQGLSDIDSVWVSGPDGSHYHLYDNAEHCDHYTGDGHYRFCDGYDTPPPAGIYEFFAVDHSGNTVSIYDTLAAALEIPGIISPANNSIVSEPDFQIQWEEVPGASSYSVDVHLASNWDQVWGINVDPDGTSVSYNENGQAADLTLGEVYIIQVTAQTDANWSQTRAKYTYSSAGLITIDGEKDAFWDLSTGHIHLGEDEVIWGDLDDENDCSADVYLAYDSTFLYGLIEVMDDVMGPESNWWWQNDAFAFRFDIDPATAAAEQDASDILSLEFTARADAHDLRNGNDYTILSRSVSDSGYILEFAVSGLGLVNTDPEPNEALILKEGTQVGFLLQLADEDSLDGTVAELDWGHYSITQNAENNVSQYGSMTLLADQQVQLSHDNLVMAELQPYIQKADFYSYHSFNADMHESWGLHISLYINDPQGLENIDSVWVEGPNGSLYILTDDYDGGGQPGDGIYTYGNAFDTAFATGVYQFYVVDKEGNSNSITDTLADFIDCPGNIVPDNYSIITYPDFIIEWDQISGADNYWLDISSIDGEYFWDHWDFQPVAGRISILYNRDGRGRDLVPGGTYSISMSASRDNTSSHTTTHIAYRIGNLQTIFVNAMNTSGTEYGNQQYPFNTIQEGINASLPGDTVLVYPGSYYENLRINNTGNLLLGSLSIFSDNSTYNTQTIIDGSGNGSVIKLWDCLDTVTICGFTLTNGHNRNGGGINTWDSKLSLDRVRITENTADDNGGGIRTNSTSILITNSVISDNTANNEGGGIMVNNGSCKTINSRILNNYAPNNASGIRGYYCEIDIFNSLLANNSGWACLDYVWVTGSVINSTIVDNPNGSFGFNDSYIEVRNSIEWNNDQNRWSDHDSIQYSLYEGGIPDTGNIAGDPMFIDAESGDYRLQLISPCINAGTPDTSGLELPWSDLAGNPRISGSRIDMGAYEAATELIPLITYADSGIVIDGIISDDPWGQSDKYPLTRPFANESFDGPDDLAAYWKAIWDADGIYVLVEVTADDSLVTDGSYGEDWEQDLVEIYFDMNTDMLKDGDGPDNGIYSGNPTNGHYLFQFKRDSAFAELSGWQTGCEIAVSENLEDGSFVQELFVPWSLLTDAAGTAFVPEENISIGFDVSISDNDGPDMGAARNRKVWTNDGSSGDEAWNNMDQCGMIQLESIAPPLTLTVSSDKSMVCPGDEVQLLATPEGNQETCSYEWTSVPPGSVYSFSDPVVSPEATTTYVVSVTDGSSTAIDSITIFIHPLPEADAGTDASIPLNTSITLNGSATGGSGLYSYEWFPADSFVYAATQNPTSHNLGTSNMFSLQVTDYQTGCSNTDQVLVTVTGGSLRLDISRSNDSICLGEEISMLAIASGGTGDYTYSWTSDPSGITATTADISDVPSQSTDYQVIVNDGVSTESDLAAIIVNIINEPVSEDVSVCYGETVPALTATGTNLKWYDDISLINMIEAGNTLETGLTATGEYPFYLTQTKNNCISPVKTVTLSIHEIPVVILSPSDTTIMPDEPVMLTASGATSYEWSPFDSVDEFDNDTAWVSPEENTIYSVAGTNEQGCTDTAKMTVSVYCPACDASQIIFNPSGTISYFCENLVYRNNSDCSWLIYPSGASSIYLLFDSIDIDPGDYVRVYRGLDENGELLGEYNNDILPAEQLQAGAEMYIQFLSDEDKTGSGFTARYRINAPVNPLGIEADNYISGLRIYPNPATGSLHIDFVSPDETSMNIKVFNSMLQLVDTRKVAVIQGLNHEILYLSGMMPGVYYLQLSSEEVNIIRKIIVY